MQLHKIPKSVPKVSIAYIPPKWYNGLQYRKLAPTRGMMQEYEQGIINNFALRKKYENHIYSKYDPLHTASEIQKLTNSKDVCLLIYEHENEFSTRHSIVKWFRYNDIPIINVQ